MATSLQAQLVQIAANSTHPLDLKAQRKAHSQSLLWDPVDAAKQDFDTLYQICVDGFRDLCQIDSRFAPYARTLFAEQSKQQDRTQLTAGQNAELDSILESFLSLVAGRLLLKPAIRVVEWLVRRFRIHELNTSATIFTFLPYHTLPMFATLLSILPAKLPPAFRFLGPYKQSLACPPRHAIVQAAVQSLPFFTSFNDFTIACCRRRHQYTTLTSFWGTITTEAIAGQIGLAGSVRKEARRQKEEDVLLRILPTLNDGLSLRNASDLQLACYMIITTLVTGLHPPDYVLLAIIEAVAINSTGLDGMAELICISLLCQHRREARLPKRVADVLLDVADLASKIELLGKQYAMDQLSLGIVLAALDRLQGATAEKNVLLVGQILAQGLMDNEHLTRAIRAIVDTIENHGPAQNEQFDVQSQLIETILQLATSADLGQAAKVAIKSIRPDMQGLGDGLDAIMPVPEKEDFDPANKGMMDADEENNFEAQLRSIPEKIATQSFLNADRPAHWEELTQLCTGAGRSPGRWLRIRGIQAFTAKDSTHLLPFLTLLARFWSGPGSPGAREFAIRTVADCVRDTSYVYDFQLLLPYALVALADSAALVRRAAARLLTIMHTTHAPNPSELSTLGEDEEVYSRQADARHLWMSHSDAEAFVNVLLQNVEECKLDPLYAGRLLVVSLSGGKLEGKQVKALKTSQKESILSFLVAHILNTPVLAARLRLLRMLHGVGKIGSTSKTKMLLPLVHQLRDEDFAGFCTRCGIEHVNADEYMDEVFGVVSATSRDGLKMLLEVLDGSGANFASPYKCAVLKNLKKIGPLMKLEAVARVASVLYNIVQSSNSGADSAKVSEEAAATLRILPLSAHILSDFLASLPPLVDESEANVTPAKRRKTTTGHVDGHQSTAGHSTADVLRRWAFVLELVDSSREPRDFILLRRLSHLLMGIHSVSSKIGSQIFYVQALLLDCCNIIIKALSQEPNARLTPGSMPVDTVIEIFQTASSSQVQRAALLLIATMARVLPDAIIHHIMPVFTKMGHSVLQHSDEYSVHVADLAIESIIPPLLESFHKQKGGSQEGMVRLLLSFVAAFEHIPQERRLPLFSSLVEQLGSDNSLHLLAVLAVDKHATFRGIGDFVAELIALYSPSIQLQALIKALKIVHDSVNERPSSLTSQIIPSKDRKARFATCLHFVNTARNILAAPLLIRKVSAAAAKDDGEEALRHYTELLEQVMRLNGSARYHKRLFACCERLLETLLRLLPVGESIAGLEALLVKADDTILRRALVSIEERVGSIRLNDAAAQEACLRLLSKLKILLEGKDEASLVQTVISCIDSIVERFGKKDVTRSVDILRVVISKCLATDDQKVKVMAILCLATAVQTLTEAMVPLLPQAIPLCLQAMESAIQGPSVSDSTIIKAGFSFVAAIVDIMPWAISRQHMEHILRLSAEVTAKDCLSTETLDSRKSAMDLIARRLDARECLAVLKSTWQTVTYQGVVAMIQQVRMVRVLIESSSKAIIAKNSQTLLSFFLQVFGLSSQCLDDLHQPDYSIQKVEEVEEIASQVFVQMIYKLNDTHFRPLYIQMLEWAAEPKDDTHLIRRHAALYKFIHHFLNTLKSIVTSYAGMIVDDASSMLARIPRSDAFEQPLWTRLIQTLRAAFENDQDEHFQAPSRFGTLCGPLTDQLARASQLQQWSTDEENLLQAYLIPSIVALASAADSSENQKTLNVAVLAHLRSDDARVRLAAASCERALTEALGEEWLAHLPEMLPFINEGLEDDDEDVEAETRAWVRRIEAVLGESLDSMLQ